MSKLLQHQQDFAEALIGFLMEVLNAYPEVYITFGDFVATSGHMEGSNHSRRLAADINFFRGDEYLRSYDQWPKFWDDIGPRWERRCPDARWGGRFQSVDLNHFSFEWDGIQ